MKPKRKRLSTRTAGSTRATSARGSPGGGCASSTARKTYSSWPKVGWGGVGGGGGGARRARGPVARPTLAPSSLPLPPLPPGEYVAPEKIEGVYTRSPLVAQAFVFGDSLRSNLVAVAVPDPDALLPWAAAHGLGGDVPALCRNPAVRAAVLASMLDEGRAAKLRGFEQVAAVALAADPFSVDNGLLTPTFKLKRPQAQAAFRGEIDAMYAALG